MSLEATVWTRSAQSFMDPGFHRRPPVHKDRGGKSCSSRPDELRLLYVTDVQSRQYPSPPVEPLAAVWHGGYSHNGFGGTAAY
ncbi:hypothetical protein J1614_001422 [Plenodomus biglobosus]|nr:hypothetical protein J1614_001422 [Plenodomus biglobosus]